MPRRSPRFLPSVSNDAPTSVDTDSSRNLSSTSPCASTACNPISIVNSITLTIAYTGNDDSIITISITNGTCSILEEYMTNHNEKKTAKSTIILKNLPTYLYTHLCAACLDEHQSSWKSVQLLCSFLPAMYITRANLPYKRELIIQTLISHIQNLQ